MKFYWLLEKQTKQGPAYVGEDHQGTLFATPTATDAKTFASSDEADKFRVSRAEDIANDFKPVEHGFEEEPKKMGAAIPLEHMMIDDIENELKFLGNKYAQHHMDHLNATKNLRAAVAYEQHTRQSKAAVLQRIEKLYEEQHKRNNRG